MKGEQKGEQTKGEVMSGQADDRIQAGIQNLSAKIRRFQGRGLGEQNTKATLIEPLLEALGWDIRDPDEVHREFKPTAKDNPVDYALKLMRKPRLFVEAKGLEENLSDRKWIAQVLGYATVAGVEWCVLTDGDEYCFYNATAAVDADEKLFCRVRISTDPEANVHETLNLISRPNMEENLLDVLWSAHFVDRRVKDVLRRMVDSVDKRIVRLIRAQVPKLKPREIAESLRRLVVRFDSPGVPLAPIPESSAVEDKPTTGRKGAGMKAWQTRREWGEPSLKDMISAGVIQAPLKLFRTYKGKRVEAKLLPTGAVEFEGKLYERCSGAARAARGSVTGRPLAINGWTFWQYLDANGKTSCLDDARSQFLEQLRRKT